MDSVRLRRGDLVSVTYNGRNGSTVGFFKAEILSVFKNTSLVRFEDKIAPDYPDDTWNPDLGYHFVDSDRGYVDEVTNDSLIRVGL
jgi:hypothetical protein